MDYTPFANYLKSQQNDSILCTFDKIEQILGKSMPSSAYKYLAWWSNSPTHPLMNEVLNAGWLSYRPNLKEKTVLFYKDSLEKHKGKAPKKEKRKTTTVDLSQEKEFKKNRDKLLENTKPDFVIDGKNIYFEHLIDESQM